jgi:hypothetical protein
MDGYFTENEWPNLYMSAKSIIHGNLPPKVVPLPAPLPTPAPVPVPVPVPAQPSNNNNNNDTPAKPGDIIANIKLY